MNWNESQRQSIVAARRTLLTETYLYAFYESNQEMLTIFWENEIRNEEIAICLIFMHRIT